MLLYTQDILKICAHWLAMCNTALFMKDVYFYFSLVDLQETKENETPLNVITTVIKSQS